MSDIRNRTGSKGTTYQVRYSQRNGKLGYSTFSRRKDAQQFIESLSARRETDSTITTMAAAADLWLAVCKHEGRNGRPPVSDFTYDLYETRADLMRDYDWGKPIQEWTRSDIINFRSWLLRNTTRYMASKTLLSLRSVVKEMVDRDHMVKDPTTGISIQPDDQEVEIPTVQEVRAMLKACDELAESRHQSTAKVWLRYRPMIHLAAGSGMRPQEYVALPRRDILDGKVRVSQALKKTGEIGPPKTKAGTRTIRISGELQRVLGDYLQGNEWEPDDLVFGTKAMTPIAIRNFRRAVWLPMMERAGLVHEVDEAGKKIISTNYHPYSLRHHYASSLIAQGVSIKRIQAVMGHKDPTVTYKTYTHLFESAEVTEDEKIIDATGALYGA
jgi:integrase